MSDESIPEDVFHIANEAYEGYASGDGKDIRECIARAILAERNRCAVLAEHYAQERDKGRDDGSPNEGFNACMDVAGAIRAKD